MTAQILPVQFFLDLVPVLIVSLQAEFLLVIGAPLIFDEGWRSAANLATNNITIFIYQIFVFIQLPALPYPIR